jgi:Tol biopolymer transport system component
VNRKPVLLICVFTLASGLASAGAGEEGPASEAPYLTHIRQLTFEGRRSGEGYFAPDGRALVFQSEREPNNPFYQIYLLDLESGDVHRVSPGLGKTTCAFLRPGTDELLFASTHLDPEVKAKQKAELEFRASGKERRYSWDYDEHMDIFMANRDGSGLRRLTTSLGYDAEASYSPDGAQIVFCSLRAAYPIEKLSAEDRRRVETDPAYFGEIYIMNADGSDQRRLTFTPGYDGGPFFSPDGHRIIWRRFDPNGVTAGVFTMRRDGSDVRQITDFKSMSWAPFYHPSGKYVIFTSNKLGFSNFELFIVDAAGQREPVRITFTDGFDGLPVFSPNGKQLCWTSSRTGDGKSQLFLADWNDQAAWAALERAPARLALAAEANPPKSDRPIIVNRSEAGIIAEHLSQDVQFLSSESLAGRMTGSAGAKQAADFIAAQLRMSGVQPMGEGGTFFQKFEFNAGAQLFTNENRMTLQRADRVTRLAPDKDFRPVSFTANQMASGEVVFVGYGLYVPGKPGEGYDSYAGLNVSNKIALVLRYVPEDVEPKHRQELNRHADLRYKAMLARERGAKAVLFVAGPNSPNAGELVALSTDGSMADSGIVAVSISGTTANALFEGSGKPLKELQSTLDKEDPHAAGGIALSNLTVSVAAAVEHIKKPDQNVLGMLPPAPGSATPEYVMVGAHYDHLGHGEAGAMLRAGEENQVHPGADDNASGVAAVLELAATLSAERRAKPEQFRRGVLFGFWSGEELGLIGSSHFVGYPVVPLSNIVAYVNFDMVGRLQDNKLIVEGLGSSSLWRRLLEQRNVAAGFSLSLRDDPYLPTDVTAFYPKEIPVLSFFTGNHDDYHRPTDTADKLNYDGLQRIAGMARALVLDLAKAAERPAYVKVQQSDPGANREKLRVYLGTIPDYAAEVAGVKLSGTRGGSPAEKAGLKSGDVIVEFAGQKIANIYDYTYALDAAKVGKPVELVVLRDGERLKVSVTPEGRK